MAGLAGSIEMMWFDNADVRILNSMYYPDIPLNPPSKGGLVAMRMC
ncbi:hypothetical protein JXB12_12075 [candidate division KSB1 bacterium]|nr:hypothetical protein [candidate division KSB1 bacterium]